MTVGTNFAEKFLPLRAPDDGTGSAASQSPASPSSGSGGADGAAASPAHGASEAAPSTPGGREALSPSKVNNETSDDRPDPSFNLDGFNAEYLDEIEIPAETATGQSPKEAQTQEQQARSQQVPPAASPPVAPTVQVQAAPQVTQGQGAQAPQEQQAAPASAPDSPQEILRNLENPETVKAIRGWLAQNMYSLSEEEKTALDTDAVGAIPGLLSRVHLESARNTMSLIQSLVPKMVQEGVATALKGQQRAGEAMSEFFAAWPGLNQRDHGALVDQFAKMFRSTNPKASRQDAIKFVGAAIHAHLGLTPQARQANGTQPARPQPFAPARPGARPPASQVVVDDPWNGLDQNYDDD